MAYQNMLAINRNPSSIVSHFASTMAYRQANPNDIEIGDIEVRLDPIQNSYDKQRNTAYRLTWFTGRGYQVYMQMTGCLVSNPDEHDDDCRCVDCEA